MIARGEGDLAATALRELKRVPADGRSLVRHLDVVWCNYADAFPSPEFFLREVAIQLAKFPVGSLARAMIQNNVRTELCR
jgi:hypothetical protein